MKKRWLLLSNKKLRFPNLPVSANFAPKGSKVATEVSKVALLDMVHLSPDRMIVCYNCGGPRNLTRDYRQSFNSSTRGTAYANATKFFDIAVSEYWDYGCSLWYLDTGASSHIVANSRKLDENLTTSSVQIKEIKMGGYESHDVKENGQATDANEIKLPDVKYVPSMRMNFVSVGSIADTSHIIIFFIVIVGFLISMIIEKSWHPDTETKPTTCMSLEHRSMPT